MRRLIRIVLGLWGLWGLWLSPPAAAAGCAGTDLMAQLAADEPAAHAALMERARERANGQGKFWRVGRPGAPPSYLFGTFHDTGIAREPLDPQVAAALGQARLLLVEVTPAEQARLQRRIASDPAFALASGGNGVIELLSDDERAAAAAALAARGLSLELAGTLRRWLLFSALAVPSCLQQEMRAGHPLLDNLLSAQAAEAGIPVAGLEDYERVPAALAAVPPAVMTEILVETIRDLGGEEDALATSARLYRAGETAAIWEFGIHTAAETVGAARAREIFAALHDSLVAARNRDWMAVLEPELARGGVFAAFGALHLPGADGVIELLRARGFELTRLDVRAGGAGAGD
jgi:uncharacterized protein YbaP (TraB family)